MAGFLLDTNVVSELVRPRPAEQVTVWFEAQPAGHLRVSVITLGELIRGVVRMPDGRRREALNRWVREDLPLQFQGRILPFDEATAVVWGEMMGAGNQRGRPLPILDAQIGATALRHGLILATRNITDFRTMNVTVFNPWDSAQPADSGTARPGFPRREPPP